MKKVELKYAGIPFLGMIAVHYWFVTNDSGKQNRWEVWQRPNAGGYNNGHLHYNLMYPDSNVGGSPTRVECSWSDAQAEQIIRALHESWNQYPHLHRYRAFPGPNSNTFVAWVLDKADIKHELSWKAIGKNFTLSKRSTFSAKQFEAIVKK